MPEPEGPSAMSPKSEDAKALSADIIAPDAIAAWLKRNPGFLNDHPDVLAALVPPESDHGKGVLDMQRFMLERLQRDLADKHDREQALLAATRANVDAQAKIHQAVRAVLEADSFGSLIKIITGKLPGLFDIAAASFCVELDALLPDNAAKAGIILLPPGSLGKMLDIEHAVVLRADIEGDERIFGKKAKLIRSVALLRLDFGTKKPQVLLALGANAPDGFDPRQGTELLSFFAHTLQNCTRRWLGIDP
jgi:uncharacterized protein YigA (DUF484 family)